jgi:hypothetical protein
MQVSKDYDGGRCQGVACKISRVIDDHKVELTRAHPLPACFSQQLPIVRGTLLLPAVASFGPLDWVLVVFQIEKGKNRPLFSIMAGNSERFQVMSLTHERCVARPDEAACWREVEDNWNIMLGNDSKNYEITGVTLFRNAERERMFVEELVQLEAQACALRGVSSRCDTEQLASDPLKQQVIGHECCCASSVCTAHALQVMGHFREFSQKFSLLPASENKDLNLCVAWWGKSPSAYYATALNGFWKLPAHLKLDPGYFGEGFYLTRYPRYSDYYLNGLSMSKRIVDQGDILMCYTALGRPYPVTEDPFQPPEYMRPNPSSLLGKPCGPDSACNNQGSNAHDSHYVTVKLNPESGQFLPCPARQEPDFDEIVVFEPKRILPAAYVSFQRRRKTLLWLACDDDLELVKSILSRMNSGQDAERSTVGTMPFVHDYCAKLEDQIDATLFVSVSSFSRHMLANTHFKDYPSSLFRIVCAQQQYKAPDSLHDILRSHSTWAAYAPEILIFAPSASPAQPQAGHFPRNVRTATTSRECFEFASFIE